MSKVTFADRCFTVTWVSFLCTFVLWIVPRSIVDPDGYPQWHRFITLVWYALFILTIGGLAVSAAFFFRRH